MTDLDQIERDVAKYRDRMTKAQYGLPAMTAAFDGLETLLTAVLKELVAIRKAVEAKGTAND